MGIALKGQRVQKEDPISRMVDLLSYSIMMLCPFWRDANALGK